MEIDKREESAGEFVRQFKYAGSDDFFADIRSIWVSEIDGKLIVLGRDSGSAVCVADDSGRGLDPAPGHSIRRVDAAGHERAVMGQPGCMDARSRARTVINAVAALGLERGTGIEPAF